MSSPRISLIHPTSSPFSRNAAIALAEVGLLEEIITTFAYNPQGAIARYLKLLPYNLSNRIADELGRRTWVAPTGVSLQSYPWKEIARLVLLKMGISQSLGIGQQTLVDAVYASLDRQVAGYHLKKLNAIYAYEDGAATTFHAAKQRGILCFYDLPIPFYRTCRAIQVEEAEHFPELTSVLQATQEPTWKIERKEQEVQLADHIFVASSMTKKSLLDIGVQSEKISIVPYGAPTEYFHPQPKNDNCFRVLFVGRVGPRKGVHYLLEAWRKLKLPKAELVLIGVNEFPKEWLVQYSDICQYIPSVPHASLNQYYSTANVLIFPSLVEGFGLVLLEAMACGLPVITTPNTAGPDIISEGVEGFIIPIRDVEAIKEKLEWCYCNAKDLAEMGRLARQRAELLTWKSYRFKLANQVQKILLIS